MELLIALNALTFLWLAIRWSSSGFIDGTTKTFFAVMFLAHLFLMLKMSGYLVRTH